MVSESQVIAELAKLFSQPKVRVYADRTEVTIGKQSVKLPVQSVQVQKQTGAFG